MIGVIGVIWGFLGWRRLDLGLNNGWLTLKRISVTIRVTPVTGSEYSVFKPH